MKKKRILIGKICKENVGLISALAKRIGIKPPAVHITVTGKRNAKLSNKKRYAKALNEELGTSYGFMELFEEVEE